VQEGVSMNSNQAWLQETDIIAWAAPGQNTSLSIDKATPM